MSRELCLQAATKIEMDKFISNLELVVKDIAGSKAPEKIPLSVEPPPTENVSLKKDGE